MATITVTPNPLIQPDVLIDVVATGLTKGTRTALSIDGFGTSGNRTRVGRDGTVRFSENVNTVGLKTVAVIDYSTKAVLVSTQLEVKPQPTTPPVTVTISNVTATTTETTAIIKWQTNVLSTGKIEYGTTGYTTTRQPVQATPDYTAHEQNITGLVKDTTYQYRITSTSAAGETGTFTGTFKTQAGISVPPPPPTTNVLAPPPTGGDDTASLRNFLMANLGKQCELRAGAYKTNELAFTSVNNLNLYYGAGSIQAIGYHRIWNFRTCVGIRLKGSQENRGLTKGTHPQPGYFEFGPEHAHAVGLYGSRDVELGYLHFLNNRGDGVYLAQYGMAPSKDVYVHHTRVEGNGRMGLAIVAGDNLLAEDMEYHNTAWSPLDIEPEWWLASEGFQGAVNIRFHRAKVTGWIGAGAVTGNGAVFFYSGTPHITDPNPPVIHTIEVIGHTVASTAKRGLWFKVNGNGYRQKGFTFKDNRGEGTVSGSYIGNPVWINRVDGAQVHNNHQNVDSARAFVGGSSNTQISSSGNTGTNITGQGATINTLVAASLDVAAADEDFYDDDPRSDSRWKGLSGNRKIV